MNGRPTLINWINWGNKYLPEGSELKVKEIGLQPGENKHEIISADGIDSSKTETSDMEEILWLLYLTNPIRVLHTFL